MADASDKNFNLTAPLGEGGSFRFDNIPPGTYKLSATSLFFNRARNDDEADDDPPVHTHAFADANTAVTLGSSDVLDVSFQATTIPLPPVKPSQP